MTGIFHRDRPGWWALALAGSAACHLVALAIALDPVPRRSPAPAPPLAEITVSSLLLPAEEDPEAAPDPPDPSGPDLPGDAAMPPTAAPDAGKDKGPAVPPPDQPSDQPPDPSAPPDPASLPPEVTENPLLAPEGDPLGAGPDSGPGPGGEDGMAPPLSAGDTAVADALPGAHGDSGAASLPDLPRRVPPPPPDAEALRAMVARIRDQMDLPCLVALPQTGAENARLLVLGDSDLSIREATSRVLAEPAPELPAQPVLLDRRQCPAVNFLRGRKEYPAFGLSIGLVNPGILSGGRLIGRVEGLPAGAQTTLLLVDDNGVVQDLRRFLNFAGGTAEFDIPVTRDGAMRDTSQMLIAAVTPGRLNSVTNLGGTLAETFFPALAAEIGQEGVLAVIPFDLR